MADLKKLAEDISKLSLVDAVELKNLLKVDENEEVNYFNLQKYMNPHFDK